MGKILDVSAVDTGFLALAQTGFTLQMLRQYGTTGDIGRRVRLAFQQGSRFQKLFYL